MIVIKPGGGLCNYLRVVLSWYSYARSINSKLVVIWEVGDGSSCRCNGFFLDYFKEINGITFLRDNGKNYPIDYSGHHAKNGYIRNIKYHEILKPKKYMNKIIKKKIQKINGNNVKNKINITSELERKIIIKKVKNCKNNKQLQKINKVHNEYKSVHIRRTDHIDLAKSRNKFTSNKIFNNFINKNNKNLYIATDNIKTYNAFKKRHREKVKFKYHKNNEESFRKTSLRDAIIDIYMCVYSDKFMGSGFSSFSKLIMSLRREKNL